MVEYETIEPGTMDRTVRLWPVRWAQPIDPEQASRSVHALSQVIAGAGFVAALSLVLRGGGGVPVRAWVGAASADVAALDLVAKAARAVAPWIGLGEPSEGIDPPVGDRGIKIRFALSEPRTRVTASWSSLWRLIGEAQGPWQMTLNLGFIPLEGGDGPVDTGISFIGSGNEASLIAALLETDVRSSRDDLGLDPYYAGGCELEELRSQAGLGLAPSSGIVPLEVAARLMGLLARVDPGWPVVPTSPRTSDELLSVVDLAVPPHVLVQGGSGLGKTTLLEHLVVRDARNETPVVVVCPHGDLAARSAAHLARLGVPARLIDFGAAEPVTWNLTEPDPGVDPEVHASLILEVIRGLWSDSPAEFFGPVWNRLVRAAIAVLVRDPAGPWPFTRLGEVLEPGNEFRVRALERIGDRSLERIMTHELDPMLTHRDPGNSLVWLVAKIDPLIGDPTLRAIVGHRVGTMSIDGVLRGESLVVAIPERRLTSAAGRLLGGMLVGRVWNTIKRHGGADRTVHLYIDEWQRIPSPIIGEILAEGRKYGLQVRLANQNSSQLPAQLWETATGNVGAVVSFRPGLVDATRLNQLFSGISAEELLKLPRYWAASTGGGQELVAPGPAPLDGDGGAALRAGHAREVAASRRAFHGAIANALGALRQSKLRGRGGRRRRFSVDSGLEALRSLRPSDV